MSDAVLDAVMGLQKDVGRVLEATEGIKDWVSSIDERVGDLDEKLDEKIAEVQREIHEGVTETAVLEAQLQAHISNPDIHFNLQAVEDKTAKELEKRGLTKAKDWALTHPIQAGTIGGGTLFTAAQLLLGILGG